MVNTQLSKFIIGLQYNYIRKCPYMAYRYRSSQHFGGLEKQLNLIMNYVICPCIESWHSSFIENTKTKVKSRLSLGNNHRLWGIANPPIDSTKRIILRLLRVTRLRINSV